jgi:hypothetical protein
MISLIHPSRGRPGKSFQNTSKWVQLAGAETEVIVAVDISDPTRDEYIRYYKSQAHVNETTNVVQATNVAARRSTGNILVYLSDDFDCFLGWGAILEKEFAKYPGEAVILKVDDCLQPFKTRVMTIPIMNREAYTKLGYFFHPLYKSMFCDQHLYERADKLGMLRFAPHLKFEHKHPSVGKALDDETYRRSAANWNQGLELFKKHKAAGFVE